MINVDINWEWHNKESEQYAQTQCGRKTINLLRSPEHPKGAQLTKKKRSKKPNLKKEQNLAVKMITSSGVIHLSPALSKSLCEKPQAEPKIELAIQQLTHWRRQRTQHP